MKIHVATLTTIFFFASAVFAQSNEVTLQDIAKALEYSIEQNKALQTQLNDINKTIDKKIEAKVNSELDKHYSELNKAKKFSAEVNSYTLYVVTKNNVGLRDKPDLLIKPSTIANTGNVIEIINCDNNWCITSNNKYIKQANLAEIKGF